MSATESRDYGLLEQLADEFAERHRRGEKPTIQEYVDRYPALADDLREILPAMVELEKVQEAKTKQTAVQEAPADGQRLMGDFRILREIGRGGMGIVYEAEQISLGRRVALKVLTQKMLTDAKQKRRFEREARAAARLHHTNIVPVFGFGENEGTPYYVMQFIQGLGLEKVIEELAALNTMGGTTAAFVAGQPSQHDLNAASVAMSLMTGMFQAAENLEEEPPGYARTVTGPLNNGSNSSHFSGAGPSSNGSGSSSGVVSSSSTVSSVTLPGRGGGIVRLSYWQSVARVGAQVADALEYAHKQGIIHRDIKPSNLLLDLAGTVWVADFGLAKADDQHDLTHTGDILGTLRYMPPEAFSGRVDARGDIYALGLTLYEMLALRPAFQEKDRHKLIGLVTNSEPPALRKLRAEVPRDLETIVQKAIDRDPSRRYQTAGEFAADLQRFVADEPIRARRQSSAEAAWRWARRHPGTAVLASLIVILMVGVTIASALAARHFDELARKAEETAVAEREAKDREAEQRNAAELQQKEAERLRGIADQERKQALDQRQETLRLVARQYGEKANQLSAEGDIAGALLWNVAAIQTDPEHDKLARTRYASLLHQAPVPVHTWFHDVNIKTFLVDPTGHVVAADGENGQVFIYDLGSGKLLHTLKHDQDVLSMQFSWIQFSPDGKRLATLVQTKAKPDQKPATKKARATAGTDYAIRVWNLESGTAPPAIRTAQATSNLFLKNDRIIALPDAMSCRLYDAATGQERELVYQIPKKAGDAWERTLSLDDVSPDGEGATFTVSLQGMGTGRADIIQECFLADLRDLNDIAVQPLVIPQRGTASARLRLNNSHSFSPDGRHILGLYSNRMRILDRDGTIVYDRAEESQNRGGGFSPMIDDLVDPTFAPFSPGYRTIFSPEGRYLLNRVWNPLGGPQNNPVTVFDLANGKSPTVATFPTTIRTAYGFGLKGQYLLAGSDSRFVLLNRETGAQVSSIEATAGSSPVLSPDGQLVLVRDNSPFLRLYTASTGQRAAPFFVHETTVNRAEFTPDGSRVVSLAGRTLRVWPLSVRDSSMVSIKPASPDYSTWISPDGNRVVTLGNMLQVWDGTGKLLSERQVVSPFLASPRRSRTESSLDATHQWLLVSVNLSFSPTSSDQRRFLVNLATGNVLALKEAPMSEENINRTIEYSWSPVGSQLLKLTRYTLRPSGFPGSNLFPQGQAPPFDSPKEQAPPPRPKYDSFWEFLFTSSNPQPMPPPPKAVQLPPSTIEVVGIDGKSVTGSAELKDIVTSVWAPDGRHLLLLQENKVLLWEVSGNSLQPVREFPSLPREWSTPPWFAPGGFPVSLAAISVSRSGRFLVKPMSVQRKSRVRIWDANSGWTSPIDMVDEIDQEDGKLQLSPDGKRLYVLARRNSSLGIKAIDVDSGEEVEGLWLPGDINSFDVSPDGTLILTVGAASVRLWDAATGVLTSSELIHGPGLNRAQFSSDGERVATATSVGRRGVGNSSITELRIWDARTGQAILPGLGQSRSVAWNAMATKVVQTLENGESIVYDLSPDSRPIEMLQQQAQRLSARQISGGRGLVLLNPEDLKELWDGQAENRTRPGTCRTGLEWHDFQLSLRRLNSFTAPGRTPAALRNAAAATKSLSALAERWHLDRALEIAPGDVKKLDQRANLAYAAGDWQQVVKDLSTPGLDISRAQLNLRANAHAELGNWPEARSDFREYRKRDADPPLKEPGASGAAASRKAIAAPALAMIALAEDDRHGFETIMNEARAALEEQQKNSGRSVNPRSNLWPALLVEGPPPQILVTTLPKTSTTPGGVPEGARLRTTTQGFPAILTIHLRQGDYKTIMQQIEPAFKLNSARTLECFVLAIAAMKLGDERLAKDALARGVQRMSEQSQLTSEVIDSDDFPTVDMNTWELRLAAKILRREAEKVVQGKKE